MRTIDTGSLTRNNLAYREPALYDELLADDALTDTVHALLDDGRLPPGSVLDLGCGTGRLLSQLAGHGTTGTGVDLQPDLVAWAKERHPTLQLKAADLRTVRLDTTFDVIVSVGNTRALRVETSRPAPVVVDDDDVATLDAADQLHPGGVTPRRACPAPAGCR